MRKTITALHTLKQMIAAILVSSVTAVCLAAGDGICQVTSGRAGVPNFWDDIPLSPSTRMPSVVLDDYWNSEFQRVNREVADAQNTQLILFGDSITWSWSLGPATGKEIWKNQFAAYNPINMGNSGDITPVLLYRVNHGIRAIAQVFRRRLPVTRLIMMATLPVSDEGKRAKCRQASAINAALVQKFMKAPVLAPVKIMLLGDSITEGSDSDCSYRRYLDGMLRRTGHLINFVGSQRKHNDDQTEPASYEYDVDHEGHWGKDSTWFAENMPRLLTSNVPDVAVIHLGTEDILSSKVTAEPLTDGIVQNLGKLINTLRENNGNMKIVLSTIIPVKGKESVVTLLNLKISRYVQSNSTLRHPVVLALPPCGIARIRFEKLSSASANHQPA